MASGAHGASLAWCGVKDARWRVVVVHCPGACLHAAVWAEAEKGALDEVTCPCCKDVVVDSSWWLLHRQPLRPRTCLHQLQTAGQAAGLGENKACLVVRGCGSQRGSMSCHVGCPVRVVHVDCWPYTS